MKIHKLLITVLLLLNALNYCFAQNPSIPFIEETIKIDGKLDEKVWQKLSTYNNFHNFFPDDIGIAKNPTEIKLFHNGVNLYISASYIGEREKAIISSLKRDDYDGVIVESDNFELIIDVSNKKNNGYLFGANSSNAQLDALISFDGNDYSLNTSWNAIWKSKVRVEGKKRTYEFEIPLKALGYNSSNSEWGINFVMRDMMPNNWMSFTDMSRNYIQYDLRTTAKFTIEKLPNVSPSKFIVTPSVTYNYQKNSLDNSTDSKVNPSLDAQYSITSSLRLDATINPDFSQIDVDQQVTNLTRFAVNFPERRNFFLENSDLFANLGTEQVNPFYSRRIGAANDIQFGLKLSGNITPKTRIGILDVQTDNTEDVSAENYGAVVVQQQLSNLFAATGFLLNKQQKGNFNRVTGLNLNYKSKNNKWTSLANFGKSFTTEVDKKNHFYNLGVNYTTKKIGGNISVSKVEKNYLTDIGFVPRLYNYDALTQSTFREGYTSTDGSISLSAFPKNNEIVQNIRYLRVNNTSYFDENGVLTQSSTSTNHAIFFQNTSSAFITFDHSYINLKYAFDPLQNENYINPDSYSFASIRVGYNSPFNKKISFRTGLQHGNYYNGTRTRYYFNSTYRILPFAKIQADYEINHLDLNELGDKSFHLAQFTGEIFFSNRLNWTNYVQYNTQLNNFNVNSRLQWEYKPLSYIYLVLNDNFNDQISRTNWGISFKINYRFEF
ncbi:DUF5916 domain-containing protein [Bernardetia sp. OM2101]|uniref:DUF5916 domain-containing protein n=1 Tax=Bernardetia sp. OM2101 TaxID=3344876 RepID=UPI0035CFB4BE